MTALLLHVLQFLRIMPFDSLTIVDTLFVSQQLKLSQIPFRQAFTMKIHTHHMAYAYHTACTSAASYNGSAH